MFFAEWRKKRREAKAADVAFLKALLEIDNHIRWGEKVNAIKAYRRATGKGLKESKNWVDERVALGEWRH